MHYTSKPWTAGGWWSREVAKAEVTDTLAEVDQTTSNVASFA